MGKKLWGKSYSFKKKIVINMNESFLKIKFGICVRSMVFYFYSYKSDRYINVLMLTFL